MNTYNFVEAWPSVKSEQGSQLGCFLGSGSFSRQNNGVSFNCANKDQHKFGRVNVCVKCKSQEKRVNMNCINLALEKLYQDFNCSSIVCFFQQHVFDIRPFVFNLILLLINQNFALESLLLEKTFECQLCTVCFFLCLKNQKSIDNKEYVINYIEPILILSLNKQFTFQSSITIECIGQLQAFKTSGTLSRFLFCPTTSGFRNCTHYSMKKTHTLKVS